MIKNDNKGRIKLFNSIKSAIETTSGYQFKIDNEGCIIRAYDYWGKEVATCNIEKDSILAMIEDMAEFFKKLGY